MCNDERNKTMHLKYRRLKILVFVFTLVNIIMEVTEGASNCNFPSAFMNSIWRDSSHGDVNFTTDSISGYTFTRTSATSASLNTWECVNAQSFESSGILVFRSKEQFEYFTGQNWYAYFCLRMTKESENSYSYYYMHGKQANAGNQRMFASLENTVIDQNEICDFSNFAPPEAFEMMIKNGTIDEAQIYCPQQLLAVFDFTYEDATSGTDCVGNTDTWDVCTDRKKMVFVNTDQGSCNAKLPFAASGNSTVSCLKYVEVNFVTYIMVYNQDPNLDETSSESFAFTCFAVNEEGTNSSLSQKSCREGQTSGAFPLDLETNGNGGALLTMVARSTCPFVEEDSEINGVDGGAVAGGVVGGLAFIALIVLAVLLCLKLKPKYFKCFARKEAEVGVSRELSNIDQSRPKTSDNRGNGNSVAPITSEHEHTETDLHRNRHYEIATAANLSLEQFTLRSKVFILPSIPTHEQFIEKVGLNRQRTQNEYTDQFRLYRHDTDMS